MNIQFQGAIADLTPPGVPAYDPSRWRIKKCDEGVVIIDAMPPPEGAGVQFRRVALFKATVYMGHDECLHMAECVVRDCQYLAGLTKKLDESAARREEADEARHRGSWGPD